MATAVRAVPEGKLVYGVQLRIQSQSRLYVQDWELRASVQDLMRLARVADASGFFYVAVCDHVAIPREPAQRMNTIWYDTIATLGMIAGQTSRVRLMSHVYILPYRHPLHTASAFATLDHLSGGRVILGVGAGHVQGEFAALGADFERRGRRLDEAIDAVAAAFENEFVSHEGEFWSFRDVGVGPRPVQRPRPPIWVGGSTPPALRRAAERGDGWLPQGTPRSEMPASIAYLLEHRRKTRGGDPIDIGTITEYLHVGEPTWDVGPRVLAGSPDKIASALREYGAMGINHLQVNFVARSCDEYADQMEAFGREVGPLLDA